MINSSPPRERRSGAVRTAARALSAATIMALALVPIAAPTAGAQTQCGTDLSKNPAAPTLQVNTTVLDPAATTNVTVSGSRYLTGLYQCGVPKFGGVYVFFGWTAPGNSWGPSWRSGTSDAGQFGTTYVYPGEGGGETRDDGTGTIRLVAFTPGGISGSETSFHMDRNGNWSTTLTVRGATFRWNDIVTGASNSVDCTVVTCGVFTVGAHGINSRTNEIFTPIRFASGITSTPSPTPSPSTPSGGGSTAPSAGQQLTPAQLAFLQAIAASRSAHSAAPHQVESATTTPTTAAPRAGATTTTTAPSSSTTTATSSTSTTSTSPTTTTPDDDTDADDDPIDVATEAAAAATSDLASSTSSDSSSQPWLLGGAALLVAIAAGATFAIRRRTR